jgi:CheY-like chemotaxis protein
MHNILVVDDDKVTHAFIKQALESRYAISECFNGEQALRELENLKPDVILLDVEMPDLNGYVVCEKIRANPTTQETPIIFLSARGELRDRLQGFEAGADDYIIKPFQPDELLAKINILIQYRLRRHELSKQVEEARRTAFIAISNSSDLGQAINFIEKAHKLNNFDQLANAFFVVTQAQELKCTLLIRTKLKDVFFSSNFSSVSPMEADLMSKLASENRYFDFGSRTQINFPHVSLLIKNMPLHDNVRYGRIKDFLPAMLSTMDIKIAQICAQKAVVKQLEENQQTFGDIINILNQVMVEMEDNHKQGIQIMRNMLMELDKKTPYLGLMEDQEQCILDQIDIAIGQTHHTLSQNQMINKAFHTLSQNLNDLLVKQQNLQQQYFLPKDSKPKKGDDEGYHMDVELF